MLYNKVAHQGVSGIISTFLSGQCSKNSGWATTQAAPDQVSFPAQVAIVTVLVPCWICCMEPDR